MLARTKGSEGRVSTRQSVADEGRAAGNRNSQGGSKQLLTNGSSAPAMADRPVKYGDRTERVRPPSLGTAKISTATKSDPTKPSSHQIGLRESNARSILSGGRWRAAKAKATSNNAPRPSDRQSSTAATDRSKPTTRCDAAVDGLRPTPPSLGRESVDNDSSTCPRSSTTASSRARLPARRRPAGDSPLGVSSLEVPDLARPSGHSCKMSPRPTDRTSKAGTRA